MDTISLKKYIFENNKVEYILQEIGCNHIQYHPNKEFYSCSNYNGDNQGAVNVKNNEYLGVINWTRKKEFGDNSDIITLVQYNKNMSFIETIKYLHRILNLPFEFKKEEKKQKQYDPLNVFKRALRNNRTIVNVDDINVLDDKLIDDYVPMLHIDFLKEGIMPWTRDKFGLCYSYKYKRMVIPHRYWLTGSLLGFNMRTTVQNYDAFGISKYYLTSGYNKQLNLYGLYENYDTIQKARYVVITESEKSVLKRDSLGDGTVVALSGKNISQEQIRILIGLNVEVIVGLDVDVNISEIRYICEKFYRTRPVSYIYDKWDLLGDKDAPVDKGDKIYQFLLKHRVKYDENEHNKYKESLERKV